MSVSAGSVPPRTDRRARLAKLAGRDRGPTDDASDVVERHVEDVVEDERDPLGRPQPLQDHEERKADRVRRHGLFLGVI